MVVPFQSTRQARLLSSADLFKISPLSSPTQHRVRSLIDRYQVLVLTKPLIANWLIDFVDQLLTRRGV